MILPLYLSPSSPHPPSLSFSLSIYLSVSFSLSISISLSISLSLPLLSLSLNNPSSRFTFRWPGFRMVTETSGVHTIYTKILRTYFKMIRAMIFYAIIFIGIKSLLSLQVSYHDNLTLHTDRIIRLILYWDSAWKSIYTVAAHHLR